MTHRLLPSLTALLALLAACSSSESSPPSSDPLPVDEATTPDCPPGFVCGVQGIPFVDTALPSSDSWSPDQAPPGPGETTAVITQPEPGRLCMAGRLEGGWAFLGMLLAGWDDGVGWVNPLDATARGITALEFALETPPAVGVAVQLVSAVPGCASHPGECQHWGFFLNNTDPPPETPYLTNQEKVVRAPLADFRRADHIDPTWEFDPTRFTALQIGPGALGSATGDYSFCIRDLKFLDAAGVPVSR